MGRFVKAKAMDLRTRDVFLYNGTYGYILSYNGAGADARYRPERTAGSPLVGLVYADGSGQYQSISLDKDDEVEVLRFDPEHYKWRKAMLKNSGLEHLTA